MAHPHHGHAHGHAQGRPFGARPNLDFDQAPFIVIWETTQACDLACKHCRASAQPLRDSGELSTTEALQLLDDVRRFGRVVFVFSGGDAFKRPDIIELVRHGAEIGLRMAITPATTPLASRERLVELKEAGLTRLAVSLDGSNAEIHDEFRRVHGSFDHGIRILRQSQEIGLSTQVNTVVRKGNIDDMPAMCELMTELGIVFWEVFFLVPMGRAKKDDVASAEEFETVFNQLYDLSRTAPFDLKATAAPQYSRVVMQRKRAEARQGADTDLDVLTSGMHYSQQDGIGRARNVNDGDGFMFISHVGDIYPSGFLPIRAGNVRTDDIGEVYRNSDLFRTLRDRSQLKGKCGFCSYRSFCGGSRARAYAMTGDFLAEEPFCAHEPRAH
ncbi:TIGR04053 family radical SAM/SPASM domain-containing protein [Arachnia propionica]|uniref:TIGR04053 family radical SAM/SPASM domain-containing protein n=1 Tax=Arachnia propionica TaxID=1750 RepID=A0A3P1TB03_9ACTN|nr:TIGR04053 family radical SAM/SPASM domain-containing protein [Arachnia propionica]MDO5082070.1 TIGR04053 family radical SAM/SPASM domain-containing protein [Arachnia propionica]RRD06621.1 TIGR04053 family radical SAM/SPASM domain-containing protein [Arachnia propionica]